MRLKWRFSKIRTLLFELIGKSLSLLRKGSFCRALSDREKVIIEETGKIPPSINGEFPYPPNSVVFLFDLSRQPRTTIDEAIETLKSAKKDTRWKLEFEARIFVETEEKGWGDFGGVVHWGPIDLDQDANVTWTLL